MKDDKKKLIVIGALAAVLVAIGAFSFLGGGSPPPAPVATKSDKEKEGEQVAKVDAEGNPIAGGEEGAEGEPAKNPLYAMELPQRDPFAEGPLAGEKVNPVLPETSPAPKTQPLPRPNRPIRRPSGGGNTPYIPPFDVSGPLPGAGGSPVSITPEPSNFGYSVAGTMTGGAKKIAVFTDSNGNQRMVPEGGSLDGDSKVVAIDKGSVTIEHRGKKQRLSLGGNPK